MNTPPIRPFGIVVVLVLTSMTTALTAGAQNLLDDGGFEADDLHVAWDGFWSRSTGAGRAERDNNVRHGGRHSLHVVHTGERDWSVGHKGRHRVTPGDIYQIGGWIRSEDSGNVQLSIVTRDGSDKVIDWLYAPITTSGTHDWTRFQRRLIVPAGVASLQFRLTGWGHANAWFDDVELRRLGQVSDFAASGGGEPVILSSDLLDVTIDPSTGALAIRDKRNGQEWTQAAHGQGIVVKRVQKGDGHRAELALWDVVNDLDLTATVTLDPHAPEVIVRLNGKGAVAQPIAFPHPFVTSAGTSLVVPMNEGILFPVDDPSVQPISLVTYGGHGLCMAWYGAADTRLGGGGRGVMTLFATPDDAQVQIARASAGANLFARPVWESSRQAFRYPREMRFIVFDTGGYVAMAKRYREHARQTGLLKTLTEKRKENENVDGLIGSANIWNWDLDAVELCREMKSLGMDRILWSRGGSPGWGRESGAEALKQINDLGFLTSRYDIYQDLMDPAQFDKLRYTHPDWTTEGWPKDLMLDARGQWVRGWEIETKTGDEMIPCGVLCDRQAPPYARTRIGEELKTQPYLARFIDTTTASPWRECYHPDHPMSRTDSREWKMRLLDVVSREFNLVTGCETGHDASVPYLHFFEGMLSLGPYRVEDAGRDMLAYKPPTPELIKYQVGPYFRVPLWELVYHDCVVSTWYWGDYNNKLPEFWPQRDLFNLLYGTPPMYMFDKATWERDKQRFAESYKRICPTVREVGYDEMLSHEFVTEDHTVQRTKFSGGTEIIVNFGDKPHTLDDGRTVPAMGHIVSGGR